MGGESQVELGVEGGEDEGTAAPSRGHKKRLVLFSKFAC